MMVSKSGILARCAEPRKVKTPELQGNLELNQMEGVFSGLHDELAMVLECQQHRRTVSANTSAKYESNIRDVMAE